jgi:hypothetical protein
MTWMFWTALALGIGTMIIGYISSARRWEAFIGMLQHSLLYSLGHVIFTALVFGMLFYAVLYLGRWAFA